MDRLIRGIPALALLVSGVFSIYGSFLLPTLVRATNGPPRPDGLTVELWTYLVAGLVYGVVAIWLALGVWRSRIWRTRAAIFLSVAMLAVLTLALPRHPVVGYSRNRPAPPAYDARATPIVALMFLDLTSLACLLVSEKRLAAKSVSAAA